MAALDRCFNVHHLRDLARRRLPRGVFDYVDRGTEEEVELAENRRGFDRLRLATRFLVDLTERDMGTTVFGARTELPVAIAPTGVAGLCCHRGEYALAAAAAKAGVPFTLADPSLMPMEEVVKAGGRQWFQIYMWEEQHYSYAMIERARRLGFEALVVTIDSALGRVREHNERNGFAFPFEPNLRALTDMSRHPGWLLNVLLRTTLRDGPPRNALWPEQYQRMIAWRRDAPKPARFAAMTWDDVARIREVWPRTLIVKSVLSPLDARMAVDHGADGIIVSNHGGRSMDSAVATIEALPAIVDAVGDRTTVILDSGIRRGSDVVKALALGADLTMVGRATLYGAAAGGQAGAERALAILASEFEKTMGYLGCRTVDELGPHIFATPAAAGDRGPRS
jgi:isopentenyl diphosphate isomerase/L-lactate dehydrogenase-like FMN-dependent dehydrogenase